MNQDPSEIIVIILCDKGKVQFVNKPFLQLSGLKSSDVIGSPLPRGFFPTTKLQMIKEFLQTPVRKSSIAFECEIKLRNNTKRKFNWNITRIKKNRASEILLTCHPVAEATIKNTPKIKTACNRMRNHPLTHGCEELSRLLNNIDEFVYAVDLTKGKEGMITFLSRSCQLLTGIKSTDLPCNPRLWFSLLHPEDTESVIGAVREMIATGKCVTRMYRLRNNLSGDYVWLEDKLTPSTDHRGNIISFYGSARDITDRVNFEVQIKKSEEKYRLISENNFDVVTLRDTQFTLLFVSSSVTKILGYSVDEYKRLSSFDILHPSDHEKYRQIPKMGGAEPYFLELRVLHKQGHYIWMQTVFKTVYDSAGDVTQIVASARDITFTKNLERELKEQEQKYRSIFENALIGIFRGNFFTNTPIDANEVCIKLFGYESKEDFIGNFCKANRHFDENDRERLLRDLLLQSSVMNYRMKFYRRDGSVFYADLNMKLLSQDGLAEGVIVDITERKAVEDRLQRNLMEKELLLKEIHHRVKNNLQIISSLLNLQLRKIDDPKFREPLIESHSRIHAIALIHEKLYLSNDISTINFSAYLNSLTKSLISLNAEKKVKVIYEMDEFLTDINVAIPLGLVCYEILSNAFKHAFAPGLEGSLYVTLNTGKELTELLIRDTGKGFDTSLLNSSRTLGWKLISNLATQAKAELNVNSTPGNGSVFSIVLKSSVRVSD